MTVRLTDERIIKAISFEFEYDSVTKKMNLSFFVANQAWLQKAVHSHIQVISTTPLSENVSLIKTNSSRTINYQAVWKVENFFWKEKLDDHCNAFQLLQPYQALLEEADSKKQFWFWTSNSRWDNFFTIFGCTKRFCIYHQLSLSYSCRWYHFSYSKILLNFNLRSDYRSQQLFLDLSLGNCRRSGSQFLDQLSLSPLQSHSKC